MFNSEEASQISGWPRYSLRRIARHYLSPEVWGGPGESHQWDEMSVLGLTAGRQARLWLSFDKSMELAKWVAGLERDRMLEEFALGKTCIPIAAGHAAKHGLVTYESVRDLDSELVKRSLEKGIVPMAIDLQGIWADFSTAADQLRAKRRTPRTGTPA